MKENPKPGDRVRIVKGSHPTCNWVSEMDESIGDEFEVTAGMLSSYEDRIGYNNWYFVKEWLELIEADKPKKSIMKTVSNMMRRLLDADTQKLVKAGFINGDLELTAEGQSAMNAVLFEANKAALVKLAQEKLDEQKEG